MPAWAEAWRSTPLARSAQRRGSLAGRPRCKRARREGIRSAKPEASRGNPFVRAFPYDKKKRRRNGATGQPSTNSTRKPILGLPPTQAFFTAACSACSMVVLTPSVVCNFGRGPAASMKASARTCKAHARRNRICLGHYGSSKERLCSSSLQRTSNSGTFSNTRLILHSSAFSKTATYSKNIQVNIF